MTSRALRTALCLSTALLAAVSLAAQDTTGTASQEGIVTPGIDDPGTAGAVEAVPETAPRRRGRRESETEGVRLDKELSLGGKVTTTGWSFFVDYTRFIDRSRKRVYQFEFMELKHPKQVKQSNEFSFPPFGLESPKSYVYGKQNNLYVFHLGYGARYLLGDKAPKSGVEVNFSWTAGPSIGLLKPYYLNLIETGDFITIVADKYDPDDPGRFLTSQAIYGAAGFSYGLGEISVLPGAYAKAGVNFDWANYSEFIKSLEAGIGADLFIREAPIMILESNKFHFVYLYLSLQLGKKW